MKLNCTYVEALCLAQKEAMSEDENVFIYGPDCGDHKMTFNSTKDLKKQFGERRVFSTPLSEDALLGIGVGAAISGLRPINVFIRADFILLSLNQLARAGIVRNYSAGKLQCPITIRAIIGRSWGNGAEHTKDVYPMFKFLPGIKVIVPSTPQEAYSGLKAAIKSNDPVVCMEPRWLYSHNAEVNTELSIPLENWKHLWCDLPPTPTTKPLEIEYYKMKYGVETDSQMDNFRGPF